MMNIKHSKARLPVVKGVAIFWGIVGAVLLVSVAFGWYWLSNGINRYNGIERETAQKAVNFEQKASSISPLPSFARRLYVEDVRPVTENERAEHCTNDSYREDRNDSRHYAVVIRRQRLLGSSDAVVEYACEFMQFDEGYLK